MHSDESAEPGLLGVDAFEPFTEALGSRLRQLREQRRPPWTTDQVAKHAQLFGLSWHRTTVGQIERGKRAITAAELLLLPRIYAVPFQEVLPQETVRITETTAVSAAALWRLIIDDKALWPTEGWSTAEGRRAAESTVEEMATAVQYVESLVEGPWPKGSPENRSKPDEAETKAAARLQTTPQYVAYAARQIWGRGLTVERDHRIERRGDVTDEKRAVQAARGHVTRALLKELEPVIKALENRRGEPNQPIDLDTLGPIRFSRSKDGS